MARERGDPVSSSGPAGEAFTPIADSPAADIRGAELVPGQRMPNGAAPGSAHGSTTERREGEAGPPTLESLTGERDDARQQAQEYLTLAQQARADYQNLRRRAEHERAEALDRGRGEAALAILPVLDDFERALSALPPNRRDEDWLEGLLLIERKLRSSLEGLGVERIDAEGKAFDPWEHEAVLDDVRDDVEPGTITAVVRPGYRLGGKVLRHAQVVVAKRP